MTVAEERNTSRDRDRSPTPDVDGVMRLTREGDQLVPVRLSGALPTRPAIVKPVSERPLAGHPALTNADSDIDTSDPIVVINRARLQALHQARASSPAVADAFFSWFWALFVFVGIGAATEVFLDLRIAWAVGASFGVECVSCGVFFELLERRERAIIRRAGGTVPPRPSFRWQHLSPLHVVRQARAHLTALTIDDSELEDQLDALVRAGCDSYDLRPENQVLGRPPRQRPRR